LARFHVSLTPGIRLGQYEISAQIGAGGMGEVYRALDTTLARQVAIKVLPVAFASDFERLARFEREAKTLAALNHVNIAQIYGFEQVDGVRALVMELVDGETLAERIARAPIPPEQAVAIARQIAEALEAAHEQGIIHRDLKPANVKLRSDGVVKVLDFGLAKALGIDVVESNMTHSPTLSIGATTAGVILGTAAYMSPEQASGHAVDRRSDVWSFGAVLYEMLSGRKAFPGESVTDTLATVLKVDPDWDALPADTPVSVRQLLRRCVMRDRKQRLQAIGEARIVLESPDKFSYAAPVLPQSRRGLSGWVAAAVCAIAFAAVSFLHCGETPPVLAAPVQRFEVTKPSPELTAGLVSPDGSRLVMTEARGRGRGNPRPYFLRALDSLDARPLPGTENAVGLPFWSSDGRYLAFSAEGKLKKIDVTTGAVQVLGAATATVGGFWTPDDTIIYSDAGRLVQIPANGGTAVPLTGFSSEGAADRLPVALPDGRHFVFLRVTQGESATYLGLRDDPSAKPTKLMNDFVQSFAPAPSDPDVGHLLVLRNARGGTNAPPVGELVAQRIDLRKLVLIGEPVPISDAAGLASVSNTGVLVFARAFGEPGDQLTIFDHQGNTLQKLGEPDEYSRASFSPDGLRVIAARGSGRSNRQLWTFDLARGLPSRFPADPADNDFPVWSQPDGNRIVFASVRDGTNKRSLYQRLSNGGGEDELLLKPDEPLVPLSWSRNGRFLGVGAASARDRTHFVITLDAKGQPVGKPIVFVGRGKTLGIEFSPDPTGPPRWIAYQAERGERTEVYIREFDPSSPTLTPASAGEWQVSKGGGTSPRWNPNGKELFYLAPDRSVMSVDLTGNPKAPTELPLPKKLFTPAGIERASQAGIAVMSWDISPDGKRFLFPIPLAAGVSTPPLTVVVNWTSLLGP
jgi:Tol biopolymer transport system component